MFVVLPSYTVTFSMEGKKDLEWQVNTEQGLESFCEVLRLNGVKEYSVKKKPMPGEEE